MIPANGSTVQKFPWLLPAMSLLTVINLDLRSRLRCVVTGCFVHFIRSHLAGDIAHLLTDIVPACARSKGLELRLDVDGRLAIEPWRAELDAILIMAGRAGRNVAHRRAAGDDVRSIDGGIWMYSGLTRQI